MVENFKMATYYIATDGNDTTGDGSSATPWLTLTKANTVAVLGDTVIIKAGTYDWSNAGYKSFTAPVTYEGQGEVIFDGGGAKLQTIVKAENTSVTIKNITFQDAKVIDDVSSAVCSPLFMATSAYNDLGKTTYENVIVRDVYTRISVTDNNHNTGGVFGSQAQRTNTIDFKNCLITNVNRTTPSDYGNVDRNCAIFATSSGNASNNVTNLYIENTTIGMPTGSTLSHIFHCEDYLTIASNINITIVNSIFYNGAGGTVRWSSVGDGSGADPATKATWNVTYSDAYLLTAPPTTGIGTGYITADPLFVSPETCGYELRPTSPCKRTGVII